MAKVKPWVKVAGVVASAAAIVGGLHALGDGKGGSAFSSDKNTIIVGTNTYAGFLPFMYLNNGTEPNEDCILYKDYGMKMKVVIQDDFQAGRAAFKNGDIHLLYCTADAFPVEMSEGSDMADAKFINISNWSRGADAIVVNKYVNTVADLKGKVVACSEGTASNTLLLNTLESNNMDYSMVNTSSTVMPDKVNLKVVPSGLDAASIFKAGQCDAAVVFSPDDQDIVATMPGSKVLVSTKQASNIICDGLIAKGQWVEDNREKATKLISALLYANSKMNTDEAAVKQAAKAFAKAYGTDEEFAIEGSHNIYYCTLGDEANFFGLNSGYQGIKGDELYNKMARTYEGLRLCKAPLAWRKVNDASIIESLYENPSLVKGNQEAEKTQEFEAVTEQAAAEMKEIS
ncbi:MAG: ABC transporter substrate-binding protein, partial [Bacteroidales bacterium]|nr:ABC transporter substrate-binding protein [Bacteroidales bacterium]